MGSLRTLRHQIKEDEPITLAQIRERLIEIGLDYVGEVGVWRHLRYDFMFKHLSLLLFECSDRTYVVRWEMLLPGVGCNDYEPKYNGFSYKEGQEKLLLGRLESVVDDWKAVGHAVFGW